MTVKAFQRIWCLECSRMVGFIVPTAGPTAVQKALTNHNPAHTNWVFSGIQLIDDADLAAPE